MRRSISSLRVGAIALIILLVSNFLEPQSFFALNSAEQVTQSRRIQRWHFTTSTFPKLIIITPTNRPYYLTRQLHFVRPLRNCFDVRWLIIHRVEPEITAFAPAFRDQFSWIDEVRAFYNDSSYGGEERNLGRELAINSTSDDAMVYFLDDDNVMPDLCSVIDTRTLNLQTVYYADQVHCDKLRLATTEKTWAEYWNTSSIFEKQLKFKMDTASFMIPLASLRRSRHVRWGLHAVSDTPFFAAVLSIWLEYRGPRFVKRLPQVQFFYNTLSDRNGCLRKPWSETMLRESYAEYQHLLGDMSAYHGGSPVVPHDYAHILGAIRRALPVDVPMTYLELGIGLGASSLFMSRHELPTNVIGVDTFTSSSQREVAMLLRSVLQGPGSIDWVDGKTQMVSSTVKSIMETKLRVSTIDILHINADHAPASVIADFELYSPLVAYGGFIVFDEFEDTLRSDGGVRKALMALTEDSRIRLDRYDVIGTVSNVAHAGPIYPDPDNRDWPACSSKEFILRKKRWSHEPPPLPKLFLITVTKQSHYLTRTLPHTLPLRSCFDVRWIIVHRVDSAVAFAPAFRDHFKWVQEVRTWSDDESGAHDRALGIDLALNTTRDDALVYFLEEDNILPDLCNTVNTAKVHLETLYYADQALCGQLRFNTLKRNFTDYKNISLIYETQIRGQMDNGSFFVPLTALRHLKKQTRIPSELASIGDMFTTLIYLWSDLKGSDYVKRLPGLTFNYKHVSDRFGCQSLPWRQSTINESLTTYRHLLGAINIHREQTSREKLSDLKVPGEYVHILGALRWSFSTTALYVEVGVGIGATSLLMSRHCLHTNVIGVDEFRVPLQREDADSMRAALGGNGSINWIAADPRLGAPRVKDILINELRAPGIDILMIHNNFSAAGVVSIFEAYAPFVSEGGFVIFDEFLDVRKALMLLIEGGQMNSSEFDFIGFFPNEAESHLTLNPARRERSQETSKLFVVRRKIRTTTVLPKLILITTTAGRGYYLARSLPAVMSVRNCFDVHWIIVHRVECNISSFARSFRGYFGWITEVRTFNGDDTSGTHERNFGIDIALQSTHSNALVYFLTDDNSPPELCSMLTATGLNPDTLYYADQGQCGLVRESSSRRNWTDFKNFASIFEHQVKDKMNLGSVLIPLELLHSARADHSRLTDTHFLADLVCRWLAQNGLDAIKRLPTTRFNFEHINDQSGCIRKPWKTSLLARSLEEYRQLLGNMTAQQNQSSVDALSNVETVVPHEHAHILSAIRWTLPPLEHATYLEIGVGLGATSLLMSRHLLRTNVIGVDEFLSRNQMKDAEAMRSAFQGLGLIQWVRGMRFVRSAMASLKALHVDILYINGDHSTAAVIKAWGLYSPLVGEGGFVVFDEFLDGPTGVRTAVMKLIDDGCISTSDFDVIGSLANDARARPYDARDLLQTTSNVFVLRKKRWPNEPQPQQKLIAITTTNRSHYLTRIIPYMMGLRNCFDVRWIIVHEPTTTFSPAFQEQFSWVSEVMPNSVPGRKTERAVGIEFAINSTSDDALVYFLEDDTIIPYLCSTLPVTAALSEKILFGDQTQCGKLRHRSRNLSFSELTSADSIYKSQIRDKMDIGNFLVPLESLRIASPVQRGLPATMLVSALISIWIQYRGIDSVLRLPHVRFHFNHLGERTGCLKTPFTSALLRDSLSEYRTLVGLVSRQLNSTIFPNEHRHIISAIRWTLPTDVAAAYVELGIGLGITSLLMSRHALATTVIGVDKFAAADQRDDADVLRSAFQGKGPIKWIAGEAKFSLQSVQEALQNVQAPKIDILMINNDRTIASVLADFELYEPLVADGGFIIFDESKTPSGVRKAVMRIIEARTRGFDVLGPLEYDGDAARVNPVSDRSRGAGNAFILRKRMSTAESPTAWRGRALAISKERVMKKFAK
jgi:predicted O-methyltransferase YrrM